MYLAYQRGWTISPEIIHLFDAEIKQLADEVDSKSDLLALLPSLAVHSSFKGVANRNEQ
jgi:hypothetical protein